MKPEIAREKGLGIGNGHRTNPCWQAHASTGLGSLEHGPWGTGQVVDWPPFLGLGPAPILTQPSVFYCVMVICPYEGILSKQGPV